MKRISKYIVLVVGVLTLAGMTFLAPLLRSDVYKFEFKNLADAAHRDPATTAWFPAVFPKSAQDIRGETRTDLNSIWISFTFSAKPEVAVDAAKLKGNLTDKIRAKAATLDPKFSGREHLEFFEFSFQREGDNKPTLAYLVVDSERHRGLMWYTLQNDKAEL